MNIEQTYDEHLNNTDNPVAAAILTLAKAVTELTTAVNHNISADVLGHELCMGIRYGLFGTGASDQSSIYDMMPSEDDPLHIRVEDFALQTEKIIDLMDEK